MDEKDEICYSLDEVALMPSVYTSIRSRSEVDPFCEDGKLPMFVSPMTCILDRNNIGAFEKSKIIPIYPVRHGESLESRISMTVYKGTWVALTIDEFEDYFVKSTEVIASEHKVLLDCANGHMLRIYELVKTAKDRYGDFLKVMVGNIANPWTYIQCCKSGVDYVRVGIGGNINCETGSKTGFHISLPYLLQQINEIKTDPDNKVCFEHDYRDDTHPFGKGIGFAEAVETGMLHETKIVADGGVNEIDKAIKCLALGADYVMCGTMAAKCEEACCENRIMLGYMEKPINHHLYYGQASRRGIIDRKGKEYYSKNPYEEGSESWIPVEYTLDEFTTEFEKCLRSAMSMADARKLSDFIGNVDTRKQTVKEYMSFNKKK